MSYQQQKAASALSVWRIRFPGVGAKAKSYSEQGHDKSTFFTIENNSNLIKFHSKTNNSYCIDFYTSSCLRQSVVYAASTLSQPRNIHAATRSAACSKTSAFQHRVAMWTVSCRTRQCNLLLQTRCGVKIHSLAFV